MESSRSKAWKVPDIVSRELGKIVNKCRETIQSRTCRLLAMFMMYLGYVLLQLPIRAGLLHRSLHDGPHFCKATDGKH